MKTRFLLLGLVALPLQLFSQTWTAGSDFLYLNPTTTRLGIGTTTPVANRAVDIVLPSLTYDSKVGIMTNLNVNNSSSFKADIQGRLVTGGTWSAIGQGAGVSGYISNFSYLKTISSETYAAGGTFGISFSNFTGSFSTKSYISGVSGSISGTIASYPSNAIIAGVIGRDLIQGTGTLAGYFDGKVQVNGKIECEEIEVKDIAADFVFAKDYKLRTLKEVEEYIKANNHLPEIAPASETEKGVKLAEFNEKLLQKIEEITLYLIQLKQENEKLQQQINSLKN